MAAVRTVRRPAPTPLPARIRWDRVGRVALLVVLLGVLALYVRPVTGLWSTWRESERRSAEVQALERDNARLRQRARELRDPAALEREARRLGMVRPGERPFVVDGLPPG